MRLIHGLHLNNIRGDIYGGLTAAVVALPLALAFGVASGAGAIAGLYGAIFVGLFAALFGGTPAQVSGPTGPMTVVMAAVFIQFTGQPAIAFTVVIMGGALQILFGALRLGRYVTYVPFSVISGFMSGIGVIIIILQLAPLLGHPSSREGVLAAIALLPEAASSMNADALIVGILALGVSVLMPGRLRRLLPSPLMALVAGTLTALFFLPGAPVIGEIPRGLPEPVMPTFSLGLVPQMIGSALVLAVLGSIDSLLTSLIADNVTRTTHRSDRELVGQGIGNIVAGLMGGIPGAGATMRTVINVRAGGRTPLSGALHAIVLLALVLGLAPLAESIPLAVLAGILLKVGWDIVDWGYMKRLHAVPRAKAVVMLTVLALTVFVDLMTAVAVGIIMASLISAQQLSAHQLSQLNLIDSDDAMAPLDGEERMAFRRSNGALLLLHLSGPFSFCSARDMVRRLGTIGENYRAVVFDLSDVPMIDTSIAMAIEEVIQRTLDNGQETYIAGVGSDAVLQLERLKILDCLPPENRLATRHDAILAAARALGTGSGLSTPGAPTVSPT